MAINDKIHKGLDSFSGGTINERVFHYLRSLGYTNSISDMLGKHNFQELNGYKAIVQEFGLANVPSFDTETQAIINTFFGSNQEGGFWIPRPVILDQQVLWQDAEGTIPVTGTGQTVGRMNDISGNGWHGTQTVSASRPTYRTDGTYHWLEGNGSSTHFRTGLPSNTINFPFIISGTFQPTNAATNDSGAYRLATRRDGIGTRGSISVNANRVAIHVNGADSFSTATVADNDLVSAIAQYRELGSEAFVNDVMYSYANAISTAGTDDVVLMAQNDTPQRCFLGNVYGTLIAEGDINYPDLYTYLTNLAGLAA